MHDNSSLEFDGKYWQMPASSSNERTVRSSREEVAYQYQQTTLDIDNSSSDDSDNSNVALLIKRKYDTEMILPSYYCNSISTRDLNSAVPFGVALNEVVTCKLCNIKKYQNLLPCGHSYCFECILLHQKEKPSVEIKHGRKRMKAAQENKMCFECIHCLEPHELPLKYNLKNKIIYDLLDVMNQIDNPCPVHPYLTRNVKCIPCGSDNICPMCYASDHLGHNNFTEKNDDLQWITMYPLLINYIQSNPQNLKREPPTKVTVAQTGSEKLYLGKWFHGAFDRWQNNSLEANFIDKLIKLFRDGTLNIESDYFNFLDQNFKSSLRHKLTSSTVTNFHSSSSSSSSSSSNSNLLPNRSRSYLTPILPGTLKLVHPGNYVVYRYISSEDKKHYISIGYVISVSTEKFKREIVNKYLVFWMQPIDYKDILNTVYLRREDETSTLYETSILLIGLSFDDLNRLTKESIEPLREFLELTNVSFEAYLVE